MISFLSGDDLIDIWVLVLTALTIYLIITRQKRPVMTPEEYEEWWLVYHKEPEDEKEMEPD